MWNFEVSILITELQVSSKMDPKADLTYTEKCLITSELEKCKTTFEFVNIIHKYDRPVKKSVKDLGLTPMHVQRE